MNIMECLLFTSDVVDTLSDLSSDKRKYFKAAIDKINTRLSNPYLNVAVIGDFSTGKSTFINGLMQKEILRTAWLATTAVPTQIFYRDCPDVLIEIETKKHGIIALDSPQQYTKLKKLFGITLPEKTEEAIAFLTTKNEYEDKFKSVRLYLKSFDMLRNICIIDTPGVNPGASNTKSHVQATQDVLREYADATIVLFPAQNVYTASFGKFLEENAKHFMDDAVFIITMMDIVSDDDRKEIPNFVKGILEKNFKLTNPPVYECSAKYALNVTDSNTQDEQKWNSSFNSLRTEIVRRMENQRHKIIDKQLKLLLSDLINELNVEVENNRIIVEKKLEILKKNSIENMEKELDDNYRTALAEIDKRCNMNIVLKDYSEMFLNIKSSARNNIVSCTKIRGEGYDSIPGYLKGYFPNTVKREQEAFKKKINTMFTKLTSIQETLYSQNKKVFVKYNLQLNQTVTASDSNALAVEYQNEDVASISSYNGMTQELLEGLGDVLTMIVGLPLAFIDGLLDTNMAEGFEHLFDGFVNLFAPFALESNKKNAINKVNSVLDNAESKNKETCLNQIKENKKAVHSQLLKIKNSFMKEYKKIYQKKTEEFNAEKQVFENEIATYREIHERLENYCKCINTNKKG